MLGNGRPGVRPHSPPPNGHPPPPGHPPPHRGPAFELEESIENAVADSQKETEKETEKEPQNEIQNDKLEFQDGLSEKDFPEAPPSTAYDVDNDVMAARYATLEGWRTPDTFASTFQVGGSDDADSPARPALPDMSRFKTKGSYLKQPLLADYAEGADKLFLMMKDGSNILWERLPLHLLTTFTRVPNYAIYADSSSSIAGHEVIDALQNITQKTYESKEFDMYRKLKALHMHTQWDPSQLKGLNDGWNLDKFKNLPMLKHAYDVSPESEWFVFMDADTYIMMDTLLAQLRELDPKEKIYIGSMALLNDLPFAHGGSGVIISKGAMDAVFDRPDIDDLMVHYENKTFDVCCGDYMVAKMFKDVADIDMEWFAGVQGEPLSNIGFSFDDWCNPLMTFHHLNPVDIEVLWEYERLQGPNKKHITYADFYRDFVLPFLVPELEDWDNGSRWLKFTPKEYSTSFYNLSDPESLKPHESLENCQAACNTITNCLQYKYLVNSTTCYLERIVRLGVLNAPWITPKKTNGDFATEEKTISGWRVDRIRTMRRATSCDALRSDPNAEGKANDGSETDKQEGWYYRRQEQFQKNKEAASRKDVEEVEPTVDPQHQPAAEEKEKEKEKQERS